ncbi:hypothetical protein GE09DRAFT_1269921 [Coniochaeta sp. 2T2.1]|nr:hypothetical protein GE09DRAFT_1269921 [Coniochaeta sp. 2T2.1]
MDDLRANLRQSRESWIELMAIYCAISELNLSKEQDQEEDLEREEEQRKVKREAELFRRHWRGMQGRLKAAREREERRRQEAYLEEVWRERMEAEGSTAESETDWDPIEDVYRDSRERFIDLIRQFLWMEPATGLDQEDDTEDEHRDGDEPKAAEASMGNPSKPRKTRRGKKKGKPQKKKKNKSGPPAATVAKLQSASGESQLDKSNIESKDDVRRRLREGVTKDYSHVRGPMVVGTSQMPHELYEKTAPLPEEDIERLIAEITESRFFSFAGSCYPIPRYCRWRSIPAALRNCFLTNRSPSPTCASSVSGLNSQACRHCVTHVRILPEETSLTMMTRRRTSTNHGPRLITSAIMSATGPSRTMDIARALGF